MIARSTELLLEFRKVKCAHAIQIVWKETFSLFILFRFLFMSGSPLSPRKWGLLLKSHYVLTIPGPRRPEEMAVHRRLHCDCLRRLRGRHTWFNFTICFVDLEQHFVRNPPQSAERAPSLKAACVLQMCFYGCPVFAFTVFPLYFIFPTQCFPSFFFWRIA